MMRDDHVSVWCGFRPAIYFVIRDIMIEFNCQKEWTIYTNFTTSVNKDKQPKWSMLISYGNSEILLYQNGDTNMVTMYHDKIYHYMSTTFAISEKTARKLRADFEKTALESGGLFKQNKNQVEIKMGGTTYIADMRILLPKSLSLIRKEEKIKKEKLKLNDVKFT